MCLENRWFVNPKSELFQVLITYFILTSLSKPTYRIVKKAKFVSGCYLSVIFLLHFLMCA